LEKFASKQCQLQLLDAAPRRRAGHARVRCASATPASPCEPRQAPSRGATRTEAPLKSAHTPVENPHLPDAHRATSCGPSPVSSPPSAPTEVGRHTSVLNPGPLLRRDGRKPLLLFKWLPALLAHAVVLATAPCAPPRLSRRSPRIHCRPTPLAPPLGPSRAGRAAHSLAPAESSPEPELPCPPTPAAVAPRLPVPLPPFLRPKLRLCDHVDLPGGSPAKTGEELAGIPPDRRRPVPRGPDCRAHILPRGHAAK
jgi:hypothetical protein